MNKRQRKKAAKKARRKAEMLADVCAITRRHFVPVFVRIATAPTWRDAMEKITRFSKPQATAP